MSDPVNGYDFAKRGVYGGYAMRSQVEVEVAMTLDRWEVLWAYELAVQRLSPGVGYLPDFWVREDPHGVLGGVRIIEVKGHGDLWPYAKELGCPLNSKPGSADPFLRGEVWSTPCPAGQVGNPATLAPLLKPLTLSFRLGQPLLVVSNPTINSAVVRFNGDGSAQTRRSHPLTSRRYVGGDVVEAARGRVDAAAGS